MSIKRTLQPAGNKIHSRLPRRPRDLNRFADRRHIEGNVPSPACPFPLDPSKGRVVKVIYDVEASVRGKDVEYDVASDGKVLSRQESIAYDSLPAVVKTTVQKYFGSAAGLKASREIEEGKTFYEVEGSKAGSTIALKLAETGKIIEEEK
jgi:hypothetical protein